MSESIRRNVRGVGHLYGTVCAAWLIAVSGASVSLAQAQSGKSASSSSSKTPAKSSASSSGASSSHGKSHTSGGGASSKAATPAPKAPTLPGASGTNVLPGATGERNPFDTSAGNSSVTVSEYLTVDLHVQDEDLANVLQMLSLQSQRNIVVSKDVSATVSANLYNVTFYEALDAILNVNGYGYLERGNFIFVYTLDELAQIEQAQRKPVSKVIHLNYLNSNDAAEFVAPLLSEVGQIKTNGDVDTFNLPDKNPVGDEKFALSATLVVFDYPEHLDEIEKLISQLDTRPAQVLVEATILQTSLNEANAFGIDFSIIGDVNFLDFAATGGPLSAANALIKGGSGSSGQGVSPGDNKGNAVVSTAGNTDGPSTFKVGIVHDDFAIFMKLLDEITDVSIISNPKILALNRQPARVLVGQRLGYLNTTSTETSTNQTVQFLDTGTQLAFRPFISSDGMIRMELAPSVSEGVIRNSTNTTGASVSIPDEITQQLTTNVIVRDGSTIVLGGLFKESTTLGRREVPFVGDIPIIGAAFRGHSDTTVRSEIIFLIKPTIVNDQKLADEGTRATGYVERVRAGTRAGLLPFSRERMTAQLNVEAEKLALAGDSQEALWKIRRSLELNPNQPEAIRLREALCNESDLWPSRSILDRVIDGELDKKYDTIKPTDCKDCATPAKDDAASQQATAEGSGLTFNQPNPEKMGPFMPDDSSEAFGPANLAQAPAWTQAEGESFISNPFEAGSGSFAAWPTDWTSWTTPFRMGDPSLFAFVDEEQTAATEPAQARPALTRLWDSLLGFSAESAKPEQDPTLTNVPTQEDPNK